MGKWGLIGGIAAVLAIAPAMAEAEVVWVGDFETGDLSQWNYVLNGQVNDATYASAQMDLVLEGSWAGLLELHDDAVWSNGLRRVELQHRPDDARTAEGAETWFAWSFYLPEELPQDPGHSIGYWETVDSYHQMMAFNANGQDLRFITQQPSYAEHWMGEGVLTPEVWHRIAIHVVWSQDPMVGEVDVWFDGEQVVSGVSAQTLADTNPTFTQVGLLHSDQDLGFVTSIYIDDAIEGDSLEEVDPPDDPGGTGTGTSGDTGGGPADDGTDGSGDDVADDSGGADATDGGVGPDDGVDDGSVGTDGGGDTGTGTTDAAADGGDGGDGCGCTTDRRPLPIWGALALLSLVHRRRPLPGERPA